MTHTNSPSSRPRKTFVRKAKTGLLVSTAAIVAAAITLPSAVRAHTPLVKQNGQIAIDEALLGEPKGSEIAGAIEALIVEGQLNDALGTKVSESARHAALQAYAQTLFSPLWTRDAADKLLEANPTCRDNGIESGITDEELQTAIADRFSGNAEGRARGDLQLTATWLRLASKMSAGLSDEGGMVRSTTRKPTRSDLVSSIIAAAQKDPIAEMERFAALSPQYDLLKEKLKTYRDYSEAGGWMKIREGEKLLEPGMDDPRVPALRKRLKAEGFTPYPLFEQITETGLNNAPTVYDEALALQLQDFQATHGLKRDGILGPATLAALNESVDSKIARIENAMNYWRSNPNPGTQHIWANIPSYRVEGWNNGEREITMKTIVGKSRTATVAFSDKVEYIVANPKWYLPIGLFKRQKLRKLRKDPGYAERHNYTVYNRATGEELNPFTVDWTEPGISSKIQMVQGAGPGNALGELKIIFPNRHAIYLHDTPDDHLFERDVRALSSGCIRLENPVAMANWLTDNDSEIATNVFNATLNSGERERFYLDQHVNVHLTYLPATVTPEGTLEFPRDIYQKFNAPDLADGTYDDNIEREETEDDETFIFVNGSGATGPVKSTLITPQKVQRPQ